MGRKDRYARCILESWMTIILRSRDRYGRYKNNNIKMTIWIIAETWQWHLNELFGKIFIIINSPICQ